MTGYRNSSADVLEALVARADVEDIYVTGLSTVARLTSGELAPGPPIPLSEAERDRVLDAFNECHRTAPQETGDNE